MCAAAVVGACAWSVLSARPTFAQSANAARPTVTVPRVHGTPTLDDFLEMKPGPTWEGRLTRVTDFVQSLPSDGEPSTERTDIYLAYNDDSLFVIFVAFDSRADGVRARMAQREDISNDDDWVEVAIDTFHDERRGYLFDSNALGVQWDALWTEGQGEDPTFDTVYHTAGRLTAQGFVVWMAIPFKSLRFPATKSQKWGIQFRRWVARIPELASWPHISTRVQGRLNQAATLDGLENISPGRNLQLIPYGTFRSFRSLEADLPSGPGFVEDLADADGGIDAKAVFQDSLVLDVTANPDFSQVESDSPQVTANRRFEVFFPEKRPFFLENTSFFQTPLDLVFTRRIADPRLGARLTGKMGAYTLGALAIDDEAPGKLADPDSQAFGQRARVTIVRLSRDILRQSSLGVIYTDRALDDAYNRVGGIDGLLKLGRNWTGSFQAVTSQTRSLEGERASGPAYAAELTRNGRQLNFEATYEDIGEDFRTELGFVNRTGFRSLEEDVSFRFRPEGERLTSWGPDFEATWLWDRSGQRLDWRLQPAMEVNLTGQTDLRLFYEAGRERVRPQDVAVLSGDRDFFESAWGFRIRSAHFSAASFLVRLGVGQAVNFVPPAGEPPFVVNQMEGNARVTLRPLTELRIQNDYLLARLTGRDDGSSIFTNHILRSNWNWQFTKELSLRVIARYDALLANAASTQLRTTKNFNFDLLLTYRVNPWTALFAGFNTNHQNLAVCDGLADEPAACRGLSPGERALARTRSGLLNDGKQFFVKMSYLFRF